MITSLRLVNFKNFADETLNLGPFTLIVGANASGKSNLRDAFRFLCGICSGPDLAAIIGGRYGIERQPIRGTANEIIRFGEDEFALQVGIQFTGSTESNAHSVCYLIRIRRDTESGGRFRISTESLAADPLTTGSPLSGVQFTSDPPLDSSSGTQASDSKRLIYLPSVHEPIAVDSNQPAFRQLGTLLEEFLLRKGAENSSVEQIDGLRAMLTARIAIDGVYLELWRMHFLELSPDRMREPSFPGSTGLGDSGEKLPTVLEEICADPKRKAVLLSWLHELTPMDVSDLEFPIDLNGRVNLRIREASGQAVSAYSASDGTLRFLGLLAALLSDEFEGLYFIEEIDNGIHPARLHLLLDLIERQTAKGKIQVVATTHSPDVLNLINDTTFEDSVVVYRDEQSADAIIRRVAELPNARELRKSQGLGRLHTSGWMENILSFAEADKEDRQDGA